MSMNRYANLAKQRQVTAAPPVSHMLQIDKVCHPNGDRVDSIKTKTKATITMGELIMNKKMSQMDREVVKQILVRPDSIPRRKLFLVDDDEEDDERLQDVDGSYMEKDGDGDNPNKSDNLRSQGRYKLGESHDARREQEGDQDDENAVGIEQMIFENIQNGIEGDDSEDDLENEDELEGFQSEKQAAISTTKNRGQTMMHGIHVRKLNEREVIICNEFRQPIGPVIEEKDIVGRFSRFLGTIARNYNYAPLIYNSWHKVPHNEKMWEYVLKHCLLKKDVRMSQKNMHTAGPQSFARIREEMKNEDLNKEPPTLTQMFERTCKRTVGNVYVDTYDDTAKKIEHMKNYKAPEDGSAPVDPFMAVMSNDNDGHRRLYGRGVTNKLIKKVNGGETSYMVSGEIIESLKASIEVEKNQLVDMRRKFDEDHERKRAELETMRNDIENQREKLVEDALETLVEKLPPGIFQRLLA